MELTSLKGGCGPVIKRSPLDDDLDDATDGGPGPVLVLNPDADAGELVARLVELAGFAALRFTEREGLLEQLSEGGVTAVVVDSLGTGISPAFELLDAIRSGDARTADTPVVILAATDTNRLYAFQSGVDAYLVRPFHADELMETMRSTINRSPDERERVRQAQLTNGAATP